jgi:hypothetical protein
MLLVSIIIINVMQKEKLDKWSLENYESMLGGKHVK